MQWYLGTDLTHIHGVVIATTLSVFIRVVRVLPCLLKATGKKQTQNQSKHEHKQTGLKITSKPPNLWQRPIIPKVSFVGKYVGNIAEFLLLCILFDWVQGFLCCNLDIKARVYSGPLYTWEHICIIRHQVSGCFCFLPPFWHLTIEGPPQPC